MLNRQIRIPQPTTSKRRRQAKAAGAALLAAALAAGMLGACSSSQSGKSSDGGSAGASGSPNGGTAGVGGTAGTGGSTGGTGGSTGGTGGSTGGTGGSTGGTGGSTGGSGGSAGSAGSGGSGGTDACDECFGTSCATESAACSANTACKALANCYLACTTLACQAQCDTANAGGVALISAAFQCEASKCSNVCSCQPSTSTGKCGTFPLCGCAVSQNCVFNSSNQTVCAAPPPVATAPNADCTNVGCGKGFSCVGSTCRPYCQVNGDCPAQARRDCIQVVDLDNNNVPIPGFKVCRQHCDLRVPTTSDASFGPCGAGTTCGLYGDESDWYTSCTPLTHNASCQTDADCNPGFGCSTSGTCIKWCRVGTNSDCSSGQTCRSLNPKILIEATGGRKEYGFCTNTADAG